MKNFLRKFALFNDSDYIKYRKRLHLCNYPWEHAWAQPIPLEATLDQTASWPTSVWALDEPRKITQPKPSRPTEISRITQPTYSSVSPENTPYGVGARAKWGDQWGGYYSTLYWQPLNCRSMLTSHRERHPGIMQLPR